MQRKLTIKTKGALVTEGLTGLFLITVIGILPLFSRVITLSVIIDVLQAVFVIASATISIMALTIFIPVMAGILLKIGSLPLGCFAFLALAFNPPLGQTVIAISLLLDSAFLYLIGIWLMKGGRWNHPQVEKNTAVLTFYAVVLLIILCEFI